MRRDVSPMKENPGSDLKAPSKKVGSKKHRYY